MRTEAKIALVIVVIVVVAALVYFGTGDAQRMDLTRRQPLDKPENVLPVTMERTTPKKPFEPTSPKRPMIVEKGDEASIKVDLASTAPATAPTKPATEDIRITLGPTVSPKPVRPNMPARIEIDLNDLGGAQPRTHIVKSGDTLYGIAEKYYGRGDLWVGIARANAQLGNPSRLKIGQKLTIPPRKQVDTHYEDLPAGAGPGDYKLYKVKKADTFYSIALAQLGSAGRWKEIFKLNKSRVAGDPKKLRAGQTIRIPRK